METHKTKKTLLIINADDLGETEAVNRGIIEAHKNGIVTSASLMANMPGFGHAVTSIQENQTLDIGAHLNVHRGPSLTSCPHITKNGQFLKNPLRLLFRYVLNPIQVMNEINAEFNAQMECIARTGIHITHLDTEKHLHTFPFIFKSVLQISEKYSIPTVRLPYERVSLGVLLNPLQCIKIIVMNIFAPFNLYQLKKSTSTSTHRLYGVSLSKQFTVQNIKKLFANLPPGIHELSCHPGYESPGGENYIDAYRLQELRTLTDVRLRPLLKKYDIVLSTFFDIR